MERAHSAEGARSGAAGEEAASPALRQPCPSPASPEHFVVRKLGHRPHLPTNAVCNGRQGFQITWASI